MTIQHTNEKFGDTENVDLNEEKFENFSQEEDESLDIIITKTRSSNSSRSSS
jgi:hypothetical protein